MCMVAIKHLCDVHYCAWHVTYQQGERLVASWVTVPILAVPCQYSVLLRLPYFDAPRMLIVDPMHNLFLESGKHLLKAVWLEREVISSGDCAVIQDVDRFVVPSDIGCIPRKIFSGFASFTADQFKNWIVHFSLITLRDILAPNDLECWRHFVLACRLLCSRQV